jgi:hypothetical protein
MLETVCNENERDRAHFTGKLNDGAKLSAGALAKYVGTYGSVVVGTYTSVVVTLVDDRLYLLDIPLFPQSGTKFDSRLAPLEFSLDADGAVTSLTLIGALGDEFRLDRKR